jgi:hypothetical protein
MAAHPELDSATAAPQPPHETGSRARGWTGHWRAILACGVVVLVGAIAACVTNAPTVSRWLAVHTGTVNEPGPYYAFWSGFGSDITEFGVIGVVATASYHIIKRYNCHEPGCWRIGNHPAAGGQFQLCYRHHPDYDGKRPTAEMIRRLHREHARRETFGHWGPDQIQQHIDSGRD